MESTFCISLGVRTSTGFENYGKFSIGQNRKFAERLFAKLKGSSNANENSPLHLELMESKDTLPVNIRVIACTLDEMTENCKIITKEIFRLHNLIEI